MRWFGSAWPSEELRAPVCADDSLRIPVPVGASCVWCPEIIVEGDRGEEIATLRYDAAGGVEPVVAYMHVECAFRQVMGGPAHIQGTCTCQGGHDDPDLGMSEREAAIWVWDHFTNSRTFYKYDHPPVAP